MSSISETAKLALTTAQRALTAAGVLIQPANQGDILFFNGTDWTRLGPGALGEFLETQGPGADPLWAASAGGVTNWFEGLTPLGAPPQVGGWVAQNNALIDTGGWGLCGDILTRSTIPGIANTQYGVRWAQQNGASGVDFQRMSVARVQQAGARARTAAFYGSTETALHREWLGYGVGDGFAALDVPVSPCAAFRRSDVAGDATWKLITFDTASNVIDTGVVPATILTPIWFLLALRPGTPNELDWEIRDAGGAFIAGSGGTPVTTEVPDVDTQYAQLIAQTLGNTTQSAQLMWSNYFQIIANV